jgi:hypothetical protein
MVAVYIFSHALRVACILKCEQTKSRVRNARRRQVGVEQNDKS